MGGASVQTSEVTGDAPLLCDSMLGGLARWLRRAGHDAAFAGPIDDAALVERAQRDGALLLTSDGPLLDRRSIRAGTVQALFVPRVRPFEQTVHVLDALGREVEGPRCMACGGALAPVDRDTIEAEVPRETFRNYREFFRCARCRAVLWKGAHWPAIEASRRALVAALAARRGER